MKTATAPPEILARAVAGDVEAFGAIYTAYREFVFRFILRRVRHTPLAEDLTTEVFIKAFRYIGKFEWKGTDFGAWLLAISRTRIVDHFRTRANTREIPVSWDDCGDLREAIDTHLEGRPEESVTDHLSNQQVIAGLQALPPGQRSVLILRFLQDLSQLETAEWLGMTEGQVKSLQYRAVRTMARQFPEGRQQ